MKNISPAGKNLAKKTKPVEPILSAPPILANAFTALVASAVKPDATPVVKSPVAAPAVAKPVTPAFVHTVQNGRKDYKPGTTGDRIFKACDALLATNPNIAITAKVLAVALPDVKESSLGCGLSHWRQFTGRTKALMAAAKPVAEK